MIACDDITVWSLSQVDLDRRSWSKSVLHGCRVESSRGSSASNPQATVSDACTAYVFEDVALAEGDMVCGGAVASDEPPAGAMRVARVSRWTLRGAFHHLEVECR